MEISYIGYIVCCLLVSLEWSFVSSGRCPKVDLPNGRVRIRSRGRTIQFRCKRGFTRVGAKMAICLKSNQWSQQTPLCVGEGQGCPKLDLHPMMKTTKLYKGGMIRFACDLGYTRQGPEQIYCDGVKWSAHPPKCSEGMSLGCDFEKPGLCGWSQVMKEDNMDWNRHKGATPTKDTGPPNDHTLGTSEGHYLFIETSAPSKRGHSAKLISPKYTPDDVIGICMEFFYHMFGSDKPGDVGSLEVFLKPEAVPLQQLSSDDRVMSLFEMDGNQGDEWHHQELELPEVTQPFQFVFDGKKQNSWLSDIAIDDIRLYNCTNRTTTIITSPTDRPDTVPISTTTTKTTTQAPTSTPPVITNRRRTTSTNLPDTTTQRRRTITHLYPRKLTTAIRERTVRVTAAWFRRKSTTVIPRDTTWRRRITTTADSPTKIWRRRSTSTTTLMDRVWTRGRSTTTTTQDRPRAWTGQQSTTTTARDKNTKGMTEPYRVPTTNSQNIHTTKIRSVFSPEAFNPVHELTPDSPRTPPVPPSPSSPSLSDVASRDTKTTTRTNNENMKTLTPMKNENLRITTQHNNNNEKSIITTIQTKQEENNDASDKSKQESTSGNDTSRTSNDFTTKKNVKVGQIQDKPNAANSASQQLMPLIVGVAGAVVLVAIVVAVLAYKWSKKQRVKEEKEMDDQMNIITEYVETTLTH